MMAQAHCRHALFAGAILVCMVHTVSAAISGHTLAACPDKPNCVSSQTDNRHQYIAPFSFNDAPSQAMRRLRNAVLAERRITLLSEEGGYLHAEARSLVFRFVDDLEFLLDPTDSLIHVRSAARTGHSDFGVNRRRIERIRRSFRHPAPAP